MLKKTIEIPIYKCRVIVIFDNDINPVCKNIYKKHKLGKCEGWSYACVVYPPEDIHTYYVLYGTDYLTVNIFVHELEHIKAQILEDRGYNKSGSEPAAYLIGFLAEKIYDIMKKNNIQFKNNIDYYVNGKN